jgi:hypothetical protein
MQPLRSNAADEWLEQEEHQGCEIADARFPKRIDGKEQQDGPEAEEKRQQHHKRRGRD